MKNSSSRSNVSGYACSFLLGAVAFLCVLGIALHFFGLTIASEADVERWQHMEAARQNEITAAQNTEPSTPDKTIDAPATDSPLTDVTTKPVSTKPAKLHADFPDDVSVIAEDYQHCSAGELGTLIRLNDAVYLYKDEELVQKWGRGAIPEKGLFLMTAVAGYVYLVENGELCRLMLDGETQIVSDAVMDADVPRNGCVRALYIQNGALIWWSHDERGAGPALVTDDAEGIQDARFGCASVLMTKAGETYIWKCPSYQGEFEGSEDIYTFVRLGAGDIAKWVKEWEWYCANFSDNPTLGEFIAYCTTPLYG